MFDKMLKALIAVGLFANAAAYLSRPVKADYAENYTLERIASSTAEMARKIDALSSGTCVNGKLC